MSYFAKLCVCGITGVVFLPATSAFQCQGAVKARVYEMGESDPGAAIGNPVDLTIGTVDVQSGTSSYGDDDVGEFVPLMLGLSSQVPTYVEGREGTDSLAIDFDHDGGVVGGQLTSDRFDPRDWSPNNWTVLSQAWIKPDSGHAGNRQTIWRLGDLGSLVITEDNFLEMQNGGSTTNVTSYLEIAFDEWTHVAIFRGGNGGTLYMNGSIAASNEGWWGASGTTYVGSNDDGSDPYDGAIDNFNLAHFADGNFNVGVDLDLDPIDPCSDPDPGDVNCDGLVNDADYLIWSNHVGLDNGFGEGDPGTWLRGDVDLNGRVNYWDFLIIQEEAVAQGTPLYFGPGVPEPASILLLLASFSGLALMRRLRR